MLNTIRGLFKVPALEKLLTKFTYNRPVTSFAGKLTPNYDLYKRGSERVFHREGIAMKVDISDFIGYMAYFGFKDEAVADYYYLVKPGFTVLDIGANIGITVLQTAKHLQGTGKVIGFEPDPTNFEGLQENLRLNQFSNIEVHNLGLGDQQSIQKLFIQTGNNRGGNRINNKATEGFSLITIQKLDHFIDENKIQQVDLIKIDVEGFEYKVFSGATTVLEKHKPVLFIEVDDDNLKEQGDSAHKLIQFLFNAGYAAIKRADTKEAITPHYDFTKKHFDVICYPAV